MPASELNYPGPDEVRIRYTVATLPHVMRLNCDMFTDATPPFDFDEVSVNTRGSGPILLSTAVDAWVVLLKALFYSVNSTFDTAELWKYEAESFIATFQSTYTIGVAGTSGSTYNPAGQSVYRFRTQEGGRMSLNLMEAITPAGSPIPYSSLTAAQKAIVDFMLSDDNWILARDTSHPASFIRVLPGQNEALFKRRYRA